LFFAGLTGVCPALILLSMAPWNRVSTPKADPGHAKASQASCCGGSCEA
jgi:hypothetical protein